MSKPTLFLAAGHGGDDKGNTTTVWVERDELILIVDHMAKWLSVMGVPSGVGGLVKLDNSLALAGQIASVNAWKPDNGDLALDIHLDYRKTSSGALLIIDDQPISRRFADAFLARWCAISGIQNNGVHDSKTWAQTQRHWPDMGWCAPKNFPGVIIELGCLNSNYDMGVVQSPLMRYACAQLVWEAWTAARS